MGDITPDSSRTLSKLYMEMKSDIKVLEEKINGWETLFGFKLDKIIEQTTKTNGSVNDLKEWKEEVCYHLKEMIDERKDNNKRMKDIVWSFIKHGVTIIVTAAITGLTVLLTLGKLL
jgi:hypothetical protein